MAGVIQKLWRLPASTDDRKVGGGGAPPWFRGRYISTFYESVGRVLDSISQRVLDGMCAEVVWAGPDPGAPRLSSGQRIECQPDALPYHARDRELILYATEGLLSKRIRLSRYLQLHTERGTHWGEIEHVRPYFADFVAVGGSYPTFRIFFQTNEPTPQGVCYTMAPDGSRSIFKGCDWDWQGTPERRCMWWAVIHLPPGFPAYAAGAETWDSGTWDDPGTVWDGLPAAVFADLWQMFYDWKSASSWFGGLIVTALQPGDAIPGFPGFHPFDPTEAAQIDAYGTSTLPMGQWDSPVYLTGAFTGNPTRPSWASFYNISNG